MTVLATIDMSDHSKGVVDCARRFADLFGTDLQVLHCRPGDDDFWQENHWDRLTRRREREDPERAQLQEFVEHTLDGQLANTRVGYRFASPPLADAIEEIAESEQLDLVVLGASHRGRLTKFLLESTPEGVVRQADFPVIVVPGTMDQRCFATPMLTPIDVDNPHHHSLEYAIDLARRADTRLRLLDTRAESDGADGDAGADGDGEREARHRRRREVERALIPFDLRGLDYEVVPRPGSAIGAILAELEHGRSGLVLLGRREKTTLQQLLFGSTAYRLVRRLPAPVLVVPERQKVAGATIPVFQEAFG